MKKPSFDWDKYMRIETYNKVLDGISRLHIPTMFSPDKKLIYLKTYESEFETDDAKNLNIILEELYVSLQNEARNIDWSCEKLYLLEVDYITVWEILYNLVALPDDYQDPEYYLKEIMKIIGVGSSPK